MNKNQQVLSLIGVFGVVALGMGVLITDGYKNTQETKSLPEVHANTELKTTYRDIYCQPDRVLKGAVVRVPGPDGQPAQLQCL